jgi:arylsulfatase A-like enzyme
MTGRLGLRTGVVTNFVPGSLFGLPTTEHTIAELLKPAGYDTTQLGKWLVVPTTYSNFHSRSLSLSLSLVALYSYPPPLPLSFPFSFF